MTPAPDQIAPKTSRRNAPLVTRERHSPKLATCAACGSTFEQARRGRPRKLCRECSPPGQSSTAAKSWRAANRELVDAYNLQRRREPIERTCVVCGRPFEATRKDTILCGRSQCKRAREDPEKRLERERRKTARRKARREAAKR